MEMQMLSLVPREFLRVLRSGFRTNATRVSAQDREDMFRAIGNIHPQFDFTRMDSLQPEDRRCVITAKGPENVLTGNGFPVEAEVTNSGPHTLLTAPPHPVHLGYRWLGLNMGTKEPEVDYLRFPLQQPLAPGGKLKWEVSLPAPYVAGSYDLAFSLVQEWIAWFDERDHANGYRIRVHVEEAASARAGEDESGAGPQPQWQTA
jgi:hypothetical protein